MDIVELRPLKPFVGSYRCALADADIIDEQLAENEAGLIVKERVPRKKVVGLISVRRRMTRDEIALYLAGNLPSNFEVENGEEILARHRIKPQDPASVDLVCTVHPVQRTVKVPADMASSLIGRGLAEAAQLLKKRT